MPLLTSNELLVYFGGFLGMAYQIQREIIINNLYSADMNC